MCKFVGSSSQDGWRWGMLASEMEAGSSQQAVGQVVECFGAVGGGPMSKRWKRGGKEARNSKEASLIAETVARVRILW